MPKGADIGERDFDPDYAYDVMMKRIREEALEEAAQALEKEVMVFEGYEKDDTLYKVLHPGGPAGVVRELK